MLPSFGSTATELPRNGIPLLGVSHAPRLRQGCPRRKPSLLVLSFTPTPQSWPEEIRQACSLVDWSTRPPSRRIGSPLEVNFCTRYPLSSPTTTAPPPPGELSTATPRGSLNCPTPGPGTPALQTSSDGGFALQISKTSPPWVFVVVVVVGVPRPSWTTFRFGIWMTNP